MSTITWGFDFDDVLCLTPKLFPLARTIKKLLVQAPLLHDRGPMRFAPDADLIEFAREVQAQGGRIVVVTGRRTWAARSTARWLSQQGLHVDALVCKRPFDWRSTGRFKAETLRELECRAFVDDDANNVDEINRAGTCIAFLWEQERSAEMMRALRAMQQRLRETLGG